MALDRIIFDDGVVKNQDVKVSTPLPVHDYGSSIPPTVPITSPFTRTQCSFGTLGDNLVIAGTGGQTIRLYRFALTFASPVDFSLKDGSTVIDTFLGTSFFFLDAFEGYIPLYALTTGAALNINLSAAVDCRGSIWGTKI